MSPPPVYTIPILQAEPQSPGTTAVRVPAGFRWIVRDIDVYCSAGSGGGQLTVVCNAPNGNVVFVPIAASSGGGDHFEWRGRQAFDAGAVIAVVITTGIWAVSITGYQLSLP